MIISAVNIASATYKYQG